MASTDIVMPNMGSDMAEGTLVRWLKREGDAVVEGEPLVEIETEKVNVEVEAPASGVLQRILARGGETVPVGTRIALLADAGGEAASPLDA